MRPTLWSLVVTNQGVPVELLLVEDQDALDAALAKLQTAWGVTLAHEVLVLTNPLLRTAHQAPSHVSTKRVKTWVDSMKDPRYHLTVVPGVRHPAVQSETPRQWKFCPQCGCSWLSHLEGNVNLDPSEWQPCACSECGCEKAVTL